MDLIDRLSGYRSGRPNIPIHHFVGSLRAYIAGYQSAIEIRTQFAVRGRERTDLDKILVVIDGESTVADKLLYVSRIDGLLLVLEDEAGTIYRNSVGVVDKIRVRTDLGIF